jgi:hypothetical protein
MSRGEYTQPTSVRHGHVYVHNNRFDMRTRMWHFPSKRRQENCPAPASLAGAALFLVPPRKFAKKSTGLNRIISTLARQVERGRQSARKR